MIITLLLILSKFPKAVSELISVSHFWDRIIINIYICCLTHNSWHRTGTVVLTCKNRCAVMEITSHDAEQGGGVIPWPMAKWDYLASPCYYLTSPNGSGAIIIACEHDRTVVFTQEPHSFRQHLLRNAFQPESFLCQIDQIQALDLPHLHNW